MPVIYTTLHWVDAHAINKLMSQLEAFTWRCGLCEQAGRLYQISGRFDPTQAGSQ